MRLLLDTHVAIWAVSAPKRMPDWLVAFIEDADEHWVSLASLWEIVIKSTPGRASTMPLSLDQAVFEFRQAGFRILEITLAHIEAVDRLHLDHGDPFDRLILAQAITEPLRLVTKDRKLAAYSETVISW